MSPRKPPEEISGLESAIEAARRARALSMPPPQLTPPHAPIEVRLRERKILFGPIRRALRTLADKNGMVPVDVVINLLDKLEQTE